MNKLKRRNNENLEVVSLYWCCTVPTLYASLHAKFTYNIITIKVVQRRGDWNTSPQFDDKLYKHRYEWHESENRIHRKNHSTNERKKTKIEKSYSVWHKL